MSLEKDRNEAKTSSTREVKVIKHLPNSAEGQQSSCTAAHTQTHREIENSFISRAKEITARSGELQRETRRTFNPLAKRRRRRRRRRLLNPDVAQGVPLKWVAPFFI